MVYSQTNVASGGSGSYTYSVSAGTLPAGISLNTSTGTASGTPTSVQSFSYNIRVNDGLTTVTNTVSGSLGSPALNMLPNTFPNPQRGVTSKVTATANQNLSFWTAGTVNFGSIPGQGNSHFTSSGITAGIDKRLSKDLIVGIAAGYGFDNSSIGSDGTQVSSHNYSSTVYGSYEPYKTVFVDAMVGYGKASFNTLRFVPSDNMYVTGQRPGDEFFGSLSVSKEISEKNVQFMPYARLGILHATLAPYTEEGSDFWALKYDSVQVNSLTMVVGVHSSYDISQSWGVLSPSLGLEYRHLTNGAQTQNLSYADMIGGTNYGIAQTNTASNTTIGTLGLRGQTDSGMAVDLEYGIATSGLSLQNQGIKAVVSMPF